jgi:hypothetical protein
MGVDNNESVIAYGSIRCAGAGGLFIISMAYISLVDLERIGELNSTNPTLSVVLWHKDIAHIHTTISSI